MHTLRIQHEVLNYQDWKKAFDGDPMNRKQAGVKRYRIYRSLNNEKLVTIEIDFDNMTQLDSTLLGLQNMWNKIQGTIIITPTTSIFEMVEMSDV